MEKSRTYAAARENEKDTHAMHRSRMRERFKKFGLDCFAEHEMLEMLLYYSLPRVDTNAIAHRLINKFGSLRGVLDADIEELQAVMGVGEHSAVLIKMIPQFSRIYTNASDAGANYNHVDKLGEKFRNIYTDKTRETVYVSLLDNGMNEIETVVLFEGSVNSAHVSPRMIAETCFAKKAAMVALAHNHPRGVAVPSEEDIYTTKYLQGVLESVGIHLVEHYLVASGKYTPLLYALGLVREKEYTGVDFYSGIDTCSFYSGVKLNLAVEKAAMPQYE